MCAEMIYFRDDNGKSNHQTEDTAPGTAARGDSNPAATTADKASKSSDSTVNTTRAKVTSDEPTTADLKSFQMGIANIALVPLFLEKTKEKTADRDTAAERLFTLDNARIQKINSDGTPLKDIQLDKDGKNGKLTAGEYLITFHTTLTDGSPGADRQFRLYVPKPDPKNPDERMPLLIASPGVLYGGQKPEDFKKDLPLAKVAEAEHAIVLSLDAEQHKVKETSTQAIYAWNAPHALKFDDDYESHFKARGYDDIDLDCAAVKSALELTNANGIMDLGHSQGGMKSNHTVCDPRLKGKIDSLILISSTVAIDPKTKEALVGDPGKIPEVYIVRTRKQPILTDPDPTKSTTSDKISQFLSKTPKALGQAGSLPPIRTGFAKFDSLANGVVKKVAEAEPGLADLDNQNQSPTKLVNHYVKQLGDPKDIKWSCREPSDSTPRLRTLADFNKEIKDFNEMVKKNPNVIHTIGTVDRVITAEAPDGRRVTIVNIPEGGHPVPGSKVPGAYPYFNTLDMVAQAIRRQKQRQQSGDVIEASRQTTPMHQVGFQDSASVLE